MNFETINNDYIGAIIRIATLNLKNLKSPLLIFASVELIHFDRPAPDSQKLNEKGLPHIKKLGHIEGNVAFRRVAMKASDAINWYEKFKTGLTVLPIPENKEDVGKHDGNPLQHTDLVDEPKWPNLSTPLTSNSIINGNASDFPAPFLGSGSFPAKIHRMLPKKNTDLQQLCNDLDVIKWLSNRIHFDISEYAELLGGVILVIPDPDIKKVESLLIRDKEQKEYLIHQIHRRTNRNLSNLTLTTYEVRYGAISDYRHHKVTQEKIITNSSIQELQHCGHILSHSDHGQILNQQATPFIRSIGINMSYPIKTVTIHSKLGNRKTSADDVYSTTKINTESHTVTADSSALSESKIKANYYKVTFARQKKKLSKEMGQKWLNNMKDARQHIRELISCAGSDILIIDPYFNSKDLFDYLHAPTNSNISIRIIRSKISNKEQECKKSFSKCIETLHLSGVKHVKIYAMNANKGRDFHDRFLIIDENIRLLGNSFNNIGKAAGMIIGLPNPAPILLEIEKMIATCDLIDFSETGNIS